jgi:hypothetical protein
MKQIIVLNVHSIVDVITNSSSELFVCNTDKDVEFIKEALQEMLDFYNKVKGEDLIFSEVFGDIGKCDNPTNLSMVKGYLSDYSSNWIKPTKESIFILSASDNTIPCGFCEMIEDMFNGDRIHLG